MLAEARTTLHPRGTGVDFGRFQATSPLADFDMQWVATSVSIGTLLLLTQAQEPKQDRRVIHLAEVSCKTFTELTTQEQSIITAWLQGYLLPEHEPAVIDVEKLLSDRAKLTEHCINEPEDDVMTAAEAVLGNGGLILTNVVLGDTVHWLANPGSALCFYGCVLSPAEHFQQCTELLPLRNRGLGPLAVPVSPIVEAYVAAHPSGSNGPMTVVVVRALFDLCRREISKIKPPTPVPSQRGTG